jgi:hypothetical protein
MPVATPAQPAIDHKSMTALESEKYCRRQAVARHYDQVIVA